MVEGVRCRGRALLVVIIRALRELWESSGDCSPFYGKARAHWPLPSRPSPAWVPSSSPSAFALASKIRAIASAAACEIGPVGTGDAANTSSNSGGRRSTARLLPQINYAVWQISLGLFRHLQEAAQNLDFADSYRKAVADFLHGGKGRDCGAVM